MQTPLYFFDDFDLCNQINVRCFASHSAPLFLLPSLYVGEKTGALFKLWDQYGSDCEFCYASFLAKERTVLSVFFQGPPMLISQSRMGLL